MKFGPASPADAVGGVTVHTLRQGSLVLKKGHHDRSRRGDCRNERRRKERSDFGSEASRRYLGSPSIGSGRDFPRSLFQRGRTGTSAARIGSVQEEESEDSEGIDRTCREAATRLAQARGLARRGVPHFPSRTPAQVGFARPEPRPIAQATKAERLLLLFQGGR